MILPTLSGIASASGEDSSGIEPASGEDESGEDESGLEFGSGADMICLFLTNLVWLISDWMAMSFSEQDFAVFSNKEALKALQEPNF